MMTGSIAAGIQAGIGNVAADSLFSTLMSAGAAGAGLASVQSIVGTLTGMVAAAGYLGADLLGAKEAEEANERDDL